MPINITMPALSPTMTEGNLVNWLKAEGDTVESGEVIAEIETDKATMEVEAVDEGILGKILVEAGTENVPVNDVIAVLLEDGEDASAMDVATSSPAPATAPVSTPQNVAEAPASSAVSAPQASTSDNKGNRIFVSPLARRISADKGIDLSQVKGTGPRGRIVKADIEGFKGASAVTATAVSASSSASTNEFGMAYTEIPNNNIKKVTARRLTEAKQTIPHFYLTVDCALDNLLAARKEMNDAANGEYKLSVNDFIIKAVAQALKAYPAANVSWSDEAVLQYETADISVAVSTPSGLITPIVRAAETKGLRAISAEIKALAGKAREGKLKPAEFMGGSFTVSNLGMFGVKNFQAIINPPQSCILAIGAGEQRPVVENGEIKIRTVMSCTLSTDHRSVDGAVGAEFMQYFKRYIENPVSMLV